MQRGTVVLEYLNIEYQGFDEGKAGNDCNLRLNFERNEDEKKNYFCGKIFYDELSVTVSCLNTCVKVC